MKKRICILLVVVFALTLCACGGTQKDESGVDLANPWRDSTFEEVLDSYNVPFLTPAGAVNERWSVMQSEQGNLIQDVFELDGLRFTARARQTEALEDISGLYYDWTGEEAVVLQNGDQGSRFVYESRKESVQLCLWYDTATGNSCSLAVTAEDLDGFDLLAVVENMLWRPMMPSTRPEPSADELAENYFRVVGSYHEGTAGSSLAQARAAWAVLDFAAGHELRASDIPSLRHNMLAAWESLTEEERGWFDENFLGLVQFIDDCQTDWEGCRGLFEDAGVASEMEQLITDPIALESWETLRDHTLTLGNSEG